jgi:hypothetical protein
LNTPRRTENAGGKKLNGPTNSSTPTRHQLGWPQRSAPVLNLTAGKAVLPKSPEIKRKIIFCRPGGVAVLALQRLLPKAAASSHRQTSRLTELEKRRAHSESQYWRLPEYFSDDMCIMLAFGIVIHRSPRGEQ